MPGILRFRPIAESRYQSRLPRLGPKHGVDWGLDTLQIILLYFSNEDP